jgi:signal transduction histidine kinase
VQDFGIGIAQHEHSEVFKRFFRTSAKNQHTFPGMGLGLYISSEIIKRHGGDIYFESTEGKGSLFCFEITSIDAVND